MDGFACGRPEAKAREAPGEPRAGPEPSGEQQGRRGPASSLRVLSAWPPRACPAGRREPPRGPRSWPGLLRAMSGVADGRPSL